MPDLFRLVTIDDVGRARLLLDLNDPATSGVYRERDTFAITPAEGRVGYAAGSSRYAGAIAQSDIDDNDTVASGLIIRATDPTTAAATIEKLLAYMDRLGASFPTALEWRPAGLTRSVFFPVRGPGSFSPLYAARVWEDAKAFRCTVSWPVAPLAEGLPMDLTEDFRPPPDKAGGRINLITNPGAEVDTSAWTAYANATGGNVARSTAQADTGAASFLVTTTAGGAGQIGMTTATGSEIRVRGGATYTLRARVRAGVTARNASLIHVYRDSSGTIIQNTNNFATPTVAPLGAWATVTYTTTAPANAVILSVYVQFDGPATGDTFFVDSVSVEAATAIADYLDGDGMTARWEGVPHLSRSIEVAENMLADYTVDANGAGFPINVRQDVANSNYNGLFSTPAAAGYLRWRHTARGYSFYDGAVAMGFKTPDVYVTGSYVEADAGKALDANTRVHARITEDGTGHSLYLMRSLPGAVDTALANIGIAAIPAASRAWVRLAVVGRYARAEYWTTDPTRGGQPTASTAWTDPGAYGLDGAGQAFYSWNTRNATARVVALHEHPYTFADVKSPDEVLLRGVPGNAPARADVEVAAAAGTTLPFGMVGWRPRARVHNIAGNGNLEDDADGWATAAIVGLNAGGTIARFAAGGVGNGPFLAVGSSGTTAFTGATYTTYERIRRGRTYTIEFWAWGADLGNWQSVVEFDQVGGATEVTVFATGALNQGATVTRYVASFVAPVDASRFDFAFRRGSAGAFTVNIARLRIYEGAVAADPDTAAQADGRGAWAPFGLVMAAADDPSARIGLTQVTQAAAPGGQALQASASTWAARWMIDPALLLDAIDDTVIDVEVYAMLACPSTIAGATITLSAMPEKGPGRRVYTREYGGAGRSVIKPASGTTNIAQRLGTLPLEVGRRSTGRWQLVLDYTASGSVAIQVLYLVVVPVLKRTGSPTGKYNDAYYPTFATFAANTPGKLFESSGRGFALAAQGGVFRDSSIGGEPIEPDPGDNELLVWTFAGGVPDQPDGATGTPSETTLTRVRARVTPRYRLMRDA